MNPPGLENVPLQPNSLIMKTESDIFRIVQVNANLMQSVEKSIIDFKKLQEHTSLENNGNRIIKMKNNGAFAKKIGYHIAKTGNEHNSKSRYDVIYKFPNWLHVSPSINKCTNFAAGSFGPIILRNPSLHNNLNQLSNFELSHKFVNSLYKSQLSVQRLSISSILSNVSLMSVLFENNVNVAVPNNSSTKKLFSNVKTFQQNSTTLLHKANICVTLNSIGANLVSFPAIKNVANTYENTPEEKVNDKIRRINCHGGLTNTVESLNFAITKASTSTKETETALIIRNNVTACNSNASNICKISGNEIAYKTNNNNHVPIETKAKESENKLALTNKDQTLSKINKRHETTAISKKRSALDFDTHKTGKEKKQKTEESQSKAADISETGKIFKLKPEEHHDNTVRKWQLYKANSISNALNFMMSQWNVSRTANPHVDLTSRFNNLGQPPKIKNESPQLTVLCTSLFDKKIDKVFNNMHKINKKLSDLYDEFYQNNYDYGARCAVYSSIKQYTKEKELLENQYASLCDVRHEVAQFYKFYNAQWIAEYQKNESDCQRKAIFRYDKFYN